MAAHVHILFYASLGALVKPCPGVHFARSRSHAGRSETARGGEFFLLLERPAISGIEKNRRAFSCRRPAYCERVRTRHFLRAIPRAAGPTHTENQIR